MPAAFTSLFCSVTTAICALNALTSVSYAKIFASSVALICSSALACWPDGAFWSYFAAMAATTESIVSSSVPVRTPLNSPALMLTTGGEELSGARLTRICPAKPSTCKASPNGVTDSVPRRARRLRSSSSSGSSARRLASARLAVMSAPCFACLSASCSFSAASCASRCAGIACSSSTRSPSSCVLPNPISLVPIARRSMPAALSSASSGAL